MRKPELWQIIEAKYRGLHVHCPTCRLIVQRPWRLLGRVDLQWTLAEIAPRLKCSRCGTRVEDVQAVREDYSHVTPVGMYLGPDDTLP